MATGHLVIRFDQKRPSATFVWPDGDAMKLSYVDTVDQLMHLATPDRRIKLPLGETVEPVAGIRMKFFGAHRVRIEAPREIRIVR